MKNELEDNFGHSLQLLVTHLIKNAKKIPKPVVQGALDFENFSWIGQDVSTKRARLREIAELTSAPSDIHRHFEAYPHKFSKAGYAHYLTCLRLYKELLGA